LKAQQAPQHASDCLPSLFLSNRVIDAPSINGRPRQLRIADCLQTLWIIAGQVWGQQFRRSTIPAKRWSPTIRVAYPLAPEETATVPPPRLRLGVRLKGTYTRPARKHCRLASRGRLDICDCRRGPYLRSPTLRPTYCSAI
jgi:hypothetical protein